MVLFDLDNTLADRAAAFSRWARRFAAQHGGAADDVTWLVRQDQDGLRHRPEFLADVRAHFGLSEDVQELLAGYHKEYVHCFSREDESIEVVSRLRRTGLKVGIVTNGPPSQLEKLPVTGLADQVDAVCVSALVGSNKPEREIFAEAARRCAVPLDGWMVGDSPEADIAGGHNAGLTTIWLHRGRDWARRDLPPDYTVSTVVDAAEIILSSRAR